MDIIDDITRVAIESKQIIQQQQEEIEKLKIENEKLKIENETYKRAFSNLSNQGDIAIKGSGIGKYFDDGVLTVEVTDLSTYGVEINPWDKISYAPHGTPFYIVKLELNAKWVHAEKEIIVTL